jgi:predicted RNA-binding Zn-ribbon protein involved in translation (DUF1610 family)
MVRCPNCGNRIIGRARRYEDFVCPWCHATLRCTASTSAVPLVIALLVFLAFTITIGFGFFLWFIFPIIFASRAGSSRVVVVQRGSSVAANRSPNSQSRPTFTRNASQQSAANTTGDIPLSDRASKYCIYCGAAVNKSDWMFCANCGAYLSGQDAARPVNRESVPPLQGRAGRCMVCGLNLQPSDQVAYCIHCGNAAHKVHLLEWIHVKGQCPVCGQHLNEEDIE